MVKQTKKGSSSDESAQVKILRGIWNEMKALNGRVDQTNARLDQTNLGLEAVRQDVTQEVDGLRRRVVDSEVRLATATTQLCSDVQELSGLIREWRQEHRAERVELRERVNRIEDHLGLGPGR